MTQEGIVQGHVVSSRGIEVDKAKVDVISRLPPPTSVKSIRSFPEQVGFYRRFSKDSSKATRPLSNLLAKDMPFEFDESCRKAFDLLKMAVTYAPVLQPPVWTTPFEIMADASDYVIEVISGQKIEKKSSVIFYASRTLDEA